MCSLKLKQYDEILHNYDQVNKSRSQKTHMAQTSFYCDIGAPKSSTGWFSADLSEAMVQRLIPTGGELLNYF